MGMLREVNIPHPLPESMAWVDWLGPSPDGTRKKIAAVYSARKEYIIWTYSLTGLQTTHKDTCDSEENPDLWRVRIPDNIILAYFNNFDAACRYMSNYVLLGMHNDNARYE